MPPIVYMDPTTTTSTTSTSTTTTSTTTRSTSTSTSAFWSTTSIDNTISSSSTASATSASKQSSNATASSTDTSSTAGFTFTFTPMTHSSNASDSDTTIVTTTATNTDLFYSATATATHLQTLSTTSAILTSAYVGSTQHANVSVPDVTLPDSSIYSQATGGNELSSAFDFDSITTTLKLSFNTTIAAETAQQASSCKLECYNDGQCRFRENSMEYCACEPPYTGMACEAIDWNADMTMMAGTYAGIISVVGFTLFGIVVLLICFCYRKKLRKHRAEKLGHKDGKQMESGRYDLKGLSDTFQIETKSTLQTPTTGTTTINGISDLDENANERSHLGSNGLSTVDEEGLIAKQARLLDNATPRFVPSRAASLRVSRLIRDSDTIKFIDEEEFDEVDGAGNPVSRSGNAVATSIV